MRLAASLMILLLLYQVMLPLRAFAEAVTFDTTKSALEGHLPVDKIGALLLAEGFASFTGSTVSITGKPELSSQTQSLLQGTLVKPEVTITGTQSNITGLIYFNDGPALTSLDDKKFSEGVSLVDATTVKGPISSVTPDQIVVGGKTIDMSQVETISSPRVFKIHVAVELPGPPVPGQPISGEVSSVSFTPTNTLTGSTTTTDNQQNPPKHGKGGHHFIIKVIAAVALGCIIATAIAVPIALSVGGHHQGPLVSFAPFHSTITSSPVTSGISHVPPPVNIPPPWPPHLPPPGGTLPPPHFPLPPHFHFPGGPGHNEG